MEPGTSELTGKVALVTGGARGIGRAIVRDLAARGVLVYSVDIGSPEAAPDQRDGRPGTIVDLNDDVTARDSLQRTFDHVEQRQGRLDILVNNAGVLLAKPALSVSRDDWSRVIATNQEAVFFFCQEAARRMARTGGGAIVNVASTSAFVTSVGQSVYEASKAAVVMMTRSLALEFVPLGIRVNAVAPGLIDTPMTRLVFESEERLLARARQNVPIGRPGKPEEIAEVVAFLASRDADYMFGQTLVVDGGWLLI